MERSDYGTSSAKYPSAEKKYPSAEKETVAHDDCASAVVSAGVDVDLVLPTGAETTVEHYEGCTKGAVELWT